MKKCSHCPVSALCVGQRPGHDFACETVRTHGEAGAQWAATESAELNASHPIDAPHPSLVAQAVSVTKAAARFVASGCATVDQAEFDRRHAICEACEHFDAAANRCGICSCNMAIKPWMRDIECPIKKW